MWVVILGVMGLGDECNLEEIRCSPSKEWLSENGGWGFLAIPPAAFALAWLLFAKTKALGRR